MKQTNNTKGKKATKILCFCECIAYTILGIFILIARDYVMDYLHFVVGFTTLLVSVPEFVVGIADKSLIEHHNYFGQITLRIILAVIILFLDKDVNALCTMWGITVILYATVELSNAVNLITHQFKVIAAIVIIQSVIQIVFAILLINDPIEHISFHVILLGIDMLLIAFNIIVSQGFMEYIKRKLLRGGDFE